MDLPPFQEFLEYLKTNEAAIAYDLARFSSKRIKEPNELFSQEQYLVIRQ